MQRFAVPAIVFTIGLILIVLSLIKISPNLTGAGGSLVFFAIVLFGLSFVPRPEAASDQPVMSAPESLAKIFYSPAEVFQNLRHHPRWLAALLVMSILGGIYLVAFSHRVTPERIGNFVTDKFTQTGLVELPPDKVAQMRQDSINQYKEPVLQAGSVVSGFTGSFIYFAILAAVYFVSILAMGGNINYWQSLAATVYAAFPVTVIQKVLSFIILFIKAPTDIHPLLDQQSLVKDNLGVLFNPADNPVLFTFASAIGLLTFYGLWLTAKGLRNTGENVSGGIAWTTAIVVWLIGVVFSAAFTALLPGILS
ncbi:MAG: YIP1 family protein [Acidobacteriota bacterium]|nr:YIP1 family protein [Acidobacteriota bacterium]